MASSHVAMMTYLFMRIYHANPRAAYIVMQFLRTSIDVYNRDCDQPDHPHPHPCLFVPHKRSKSQDGRNGNSFFPRSDILVSSSRRELEDLFAYCTAR